MKDTRILLSTATRSAALLCGPHPSREALAAACATAVLRTPGVSQADLFTVMAGASEWAAQRARTMM
jgi:hypothetical protein